MEHENETLTTILATEGIEGVAKRCDKSAKQLLADPQFMSRLLIGTMQELEGMDPDAVVRECLLTLPLVETELVEQNDRARAHVSQQPNVDAPHTEQPAGFSIHTVMRLPDTGEYVIIEVNVESQREGSELSYPLASRIIYEVGRMLSSQGKSNVVSEPYAYLRRVVCIWVVNKPYAEKRGTISHVHLTADNLVGSANYDQSEFAFVDIYIANLNDAAPGTSEGVLGMLEVLFANEEAIEAQEKVRRLKDDYGITLSDENKVKVRDKDGWSSALIAEGEIKGKAATVLTYMRKKGVALSDALDFLEVHEPERTAVVAWIEEHHAIPSVHDEHDGNA